MNQTLVAAIVATLGACSPYYDANLFPEHIQTPAIPWRLLRIISHDANSFTEGLVWYRGALIESSGGSGTSSLVVYNSDGERRAQVRLPAKVGTRTDKPFGEGLAVADDTLYQLTWKHERVLIWNLPDLLSRNPQVYNGDGWGLCFDGTGFWRSDGSPTLHRHDPRDFTEYESKQAHITIGGHSVAQLNELECVNKLVLANVWQTPFVVAIDPARGVIGVLDLSELVDREHASGKESVLNGIAWNPAKDEYFVTGKRWSHTYVVKLDLATIGAQTR